VTLARARSPLSQSAQPRRIRFGFAIEAAPIARPAPATAFTAPPSAIGVSPIVAKLAEAIGNAFPDADFAMFGADSFAVHFSTRSFILTATNDDWRVHVMPGPSRDHESFECATIDEVIEAMRWPLVTKRTRTRSKSFGRAGGDADEAP
jgi:hypothetical protein